MPNYSLIAVDLAKSVFEIAVSGRPGKVSEQCRVTRDKFLSFFVNRPQATVVLEACGSAHHWAREIENLGHKAVLLPPQHVRPYVLRNKTDRTDAKGILEAYRNEDIRPVPIKSVEQQTLASLHRLRSSWLAERTAKINVIRGLLRELGFIIPRSEHETSFHEPGPLLRTPIPGYPTHFVPPSPRSVTRSALSKSTSNVSNTSSELSLSKRRPSSSYAPFLASAS